MQEIIIQLQTMLLMIEQELSISKLAKQRPLQVVVAEGADDAMVKLEIVRAIMALYNVEAKYIEVFSGR